MQMELQEKIKKNEDFYIIDTIRRCILGTDPRFQAQRRTESSEFFGCERVVDAMSTFGDVKDPWNATNQLCRFRHRLDLRC
jgi:hypothetical protein